MKLWRLTRTPYVALDGRGALLNGSRYAPERTPVVSLANEAALAVLISMRYLPDDPAQIATDYVLGWTEADAVPERVPDGADDATVRACIGEWFAAQRSLLAAVPSRVLPEGDVILLNPLHPLAASVRPLTTRPFDWATCLHHPPMLAAFRNAQ